VALFIFVKMLKMKKFVILQLIALLPLSILAGFIPINVAKIVARNFYAERALLTIADEYKTIEVQGTYSARSSSQDILYYVININKGGYVIVSANNSTIPVLAYAFEGTFNKEYCNVSSWMQWYEDQINAATKNKAIPSEFVSAEWKRLSSSEPSQLLDYRNTSNVSPLLVSKWNQDSYYNGQCPADPAGPEGHCYAGCVATAMGQLMFYYRFPEQGQGSYSYIHPVYGLISADFDTTHYDWNGMPSFINKQNNPIATLLFHLGVSVDMDYGPDGSGMWNHKAAYSLKNYFKYGPETRYYFRDSISLDWDSILISNLNQRKPLYYAGWEGVQSDNGHAFVCDGYQDTNYFHFNWGWGGQSDGYFYTENLTPGGSNFNYAQEVIPLFPDTVMNAYPGYCNGRTVLSGIRGSIEDGSGWASYKPNSNCSWLIRPRDPEFDSIKNIKLTFTKLDTEPGNDIIYVYDGDTIAAPLIGTYSGNTLPTAITSAGNSLLLVFETNGNDCRDGWIADYESIIPQYCTGTTILGDPSGNLEDGSGPKKYNNNTVCKWRIQPPEAAAVTITFTGFDLADSLDVLRIFDQSSAELLAVYTGNQIPDPVTSYSGKMLLMFSTNKSNTGQGWEGIYTSSPVSVPEQVQNCLDFVISPNPVNDRMNIQIDSPLNDHLELNLISVKGQCLFSKHFDVKRGSNNFSIDVSSLPPSVYTLKLTTSTEKTAKLVVID
jgi:hypothetical protein